MNSLRLRSTLCPQRVTRLASTSATVVMPQKMSKKQPEDTNPAVARQPRLYKREFADMYPDMLPSLQVDRRNALCERLVRRDQLRRRVNLDIPEFYVGSLLAVTFADEYAPSRSVRFMGICISRHHTGLKHQILLRNCFDGLGVEMPIDLYNPLVSKVELLKLQRHADPHMHYLKDALPEYSTFEPSMPAIPHPPGGDVPECTTVVQLKPPPWAMKYHIHEFKGICPESLWSQLTPWYKKKFYRAIHHPFAKYDIMLNYRESTNREDQLEAESQMREFVVENMAKGDLGEHLKRHRRRHLFPPIVQSFDKQRKNNLAAN